jgi:hypothetical protein
MVFTYIADLVRAVIDRRHRITCCYLEIEASLGFGDWGLEFCDRLQVDNYLSNLNATVASGGKLIRIECSRPIHVEFSLFLPPRLPTLLPP